MICGAKNPFHLLIPVGLTCDLASEREGISFVF